MGDILSIQKQQKGRRKGVLIRGPTHVTWAEEVGLVHEKKGTWGNLAGKLERDCKVIPGGGAKLRAFRWGWIIKGVQKESKASKYLAVRSPMPSTRPILAPTHCQIHYKGGKAKKTGKAREKNIETSRQSKAY